MKLLKVISAVLAIHFLMSSANCKRPGHGDKRLTIVNNSNSDIYAILQYNYPDTSINDSQWSYLAYNHLEVPANSSERLWNSIRWDKVIRNNNPSNTLMVFIFDLNTIVNTPWTEIQSNYSILERYDLTIEQLNDMGWKITYP